MQIGDLVFVYGTLRKGGRWHHLIAKTPFISSGTIGGTMYSLGGSVPAVVISQDVMGIVQGIVHGEVYEMQDIETIQRLKRLESGYECSLQEVYYTEEASDMAWVFHVKDNLWGNPVMTLPVVPNGDWMEFVSRHVNDRR